MASRWIYSLVITGAISVAAAAIWRQAHVSTPSQDPALYGPRIDCPSEMKIGAHHFGSLANARITIRNIGKEVLRLTRFQQSCSCTEIRTGERLLSASDEVLVSPSASTDLDVSVRVLSVAGDSLTAIISFETNAPDTQFISVPIIIEKVVRDAYAVPDRLLLGDHLIGEAIEIPLVFRSDTMGRIKSFRWVCPDPAVSIVETVLSPTSDKDAPVLSFDSPSVRRVRVRINSAAAAMVSTAVRIEIRDEDSSYAFDVPITCRVSANVELVPSAISLPKRSSSGPFFEATCFVRSHIGPIETIEVVDGPPYIEVSVANRLGESSWAIKVVLDQGSRRPPGAVPQVEVRLSVSVGGKAHILSLPITVVELK
jgi:hypothetical protein